MRVAFEKSRNVMTVRLVQEKVGIVNVIDVAKRLGVVEEMPKQLAMVLGVLLFPDIALASPAVAHWLVRILWWSAAGLAILTLANYTRVGAKSLTDGSAVTAQPSDS